MSTEARERLFGASQAFEHPVTLVVALTLAALLLLAPAVIWLLVRLGRVDARLRAELMLRYRSWLVLTPLLLVPILLGAAWTIIGAGILSLLCYREYARATGLFRKKTVSFVVVVGILAVTFSVFDHWYELFVALVPFTIGILAIAAGHASCGVDPTAGALDCASFQPCAPAG
jgi:phosphatidate cytidylyltransferase